MSEILMESIVGSVESLEKKTDEIQEQVNALPDHSETIKNTASRLEAAEKDLKEMPAKIFMPLPEILGLTVALQHHSRLLSAPMKQEVRHEHHITKSIIACIVLSLIVIGLLFLEYFTWFEADQHKDNDIKYRYLKVFASPEGQKFYVGIDSEYNANPQEFRNLVIQQEKTEQERFEDFQQMQKKQEEVKNLQEKWSGQHRNKSK